jgi:hypothetical protein
LAGSLDQLSPDDRALIEDSLSHYFTNIGSPEAASMHSKQSRTALDAHMATVAKLKTVLLPFSSDTDLHRTIHRLGQP